MNKDQLTELLLQSLEHELGGVQIYENALRCVINADLKEEWNKYLEQTRNHVRVLTDVCGVIDIDSNQESPGRSVVRKIGQSLVAAMQEARSNGSPEGAQLVACECVVLAETKDHLDWELIGKCAQKMPGANGRLLKQAYEEIEDQEDEHIYHSRGWCRELWIESLGLSAILPPLEERRDVKTAMGAARAERASDNRR
jgi:hypothetical protein